MIAALPTLVTHHTCWLLY